MTWLITNNEFDYHPEGFETDHTVNIMIGKGEGKVQGELYNKICYCVIAVKYDTQFNFQLKVLRIILLQLLKAFD